MPRFDHNENGTSDGQEDGPYTDSEGNPVDNAVISLTEGC